MYCVLSHCALVPSLVEKPGPAAISGLEGCQGKVICGGQGCVHLTLAPAASSGHTAASHRTAWDTEACVYLLSGSGPLIQDTVSLPLLRWALFGSPL